MTDITPLPRNTATLSTWTLIGYGILLVFSLGAISPLTFGFTPALLGLISILALGLREKYWIKPDWPMFFWFAAISALCFISTLWSISPDASFSRATKISTILFLALPLFSVLSVIPEQTRGMIKKWFPLIPILLALILVIELYFDFPLYRLLADKGNERIKLDILNKYASVLILLTPIALIWAAQTKQLSFAILLIILNCCVLYKTDSQAAQLGGLCLILAPLVLFFFPRSAIPLTAAAILFLLLFIPFLSPIAFDAFADLFDKRGSLMQHASMSSRLENYDFISRRIMESPLHGFGMDCTRFMTFETDQRFFKMDSINHPHNAPLQIWIEFGLIGVAFFAGLLVFVFRRLRQHEGQVKYSAYTTLCIGTIFLMVSWSMWSSWLIGLLIIVSALQPLAKEDTLHPSTS